MALAVFIPRAATPRFRRLVPDEDVLIAQSWREFGEFVADSRVTAAVIDPCADGKVKVEPVIGIMISRPSLAVFAYVPPTPWHLKAVFKLAKHGLKEVFVHSVVGDLKLTRTMMGIRANVLAVDFLSRIEPRLSALPPELSRAVQDLFERPHRYERAGDIATQAGITPKKLYRRFDSARVGTPAKLITVAKVLMAYTTLRSSACTILRVRRTVGFTHSKQFSSRTAIIFACSPQKLRAQPNEKEIVLGLFEWLYKPMRRTSIRRRGVLSRVSQSARKGLEKLV